MSWDDVRYFGPHEFACHCGNCGSDGLEMDKRFILRLDQLRAEYGAPLLISSGYRCPAHNNQVSSTGFDGPHTTGHAADIGISGEQAYYLAQQTNFSGMGINQRGPYEGRFIHLDDLEGPAHPRPRIWTY